MPGFASPCSVNIVPSAFWTFQLLATLPGTIGEIPFMIASVTFEISALCHDATSLNFLWIMQQQNTK
jgi:hypothetical protein